MKVTTEKIRGVWTVRFTQEHQSFVLSNDYGGEKKDCKWVKKMLQKAFENYRKEILAEANNETPKELLGNEAEEEKDKRIKYLENLLFKSGAMKDAPCFCCGYNGSGYYQPSKHSCVRRHDKLHIAIIEAQND